MFVKFSCELIQCSYFSRINFMKYKRNFDFLKSSRVYQMIHESEKKCPGSFTGRPEKLMAAQDYKKVRNCNL